MVDVDDTLMHPCGLSAAALAKMLCLDEDTVDAFVAGRLDPGRRRAAEGHMAACPVCRRLVSELMRAAPDAPPPPGVTATFGSPGQGGAGQEPRFQVGECVADRYRIVRFVAEGGMGQVYEAEDLALHSRVALKTVRPTIAGEASVLERFRREIHLARKVTHPNVCRIFDVGFHGDRGQGVFLSMEFLDGETLGARLRRGGKLDAAEALPLVEQMVAGLAAAHAVGVVHRDFKSQNVMLVPNGATTRLVISDFGLARDSSAASGAATSSASGIMGSPAYMAPEQVAGRAVDERGDIYALGVVLFELVTGTWPFLADTPMLTAIKRLQEVAPPARSLVPDLDPAWNAAIARCLEREPGARFQSVREVLDALASAPSAPPVSWRRRGAFIGGAVVATAVLGLVSLLGGTMNERARPPATVTLPPAPTTAPTPAAPAAGPSAPVPALPAAAPEAPITRSAPPAQLRERARPKQKSRRAPAAPDALIERYPE